MKSRIWPFFITSTTTILAQATTISELDSCNSLLMCLRAQLPLPLSASSQNSSHSHPVKTYIRSCHTLALLLFSSFYPQVAAWLPPSTPVLVIHCCVTNDCEHGSLKNTHLLFHSFIESGIWTVLSYVPCLGSHKAAVKVLTMLCSYLETQIEKGPLPSCFESQAKVISL